MQIEITNHTKSKILTRTRRNSSFESRMVEYGRNPNIREEIKIGRRTWRKLVFFADIFFSVFVFVDL